jgi:trehalose/maltose hydrolase-like predicted phosphorylase
MKQERIDRLDLFLQTCKWEIDLEAGTIKTTKGVVSSKDRKGYIRTSIHFKGERKTFVYGVHEIIAHVGGLDTLDQTINHIDGKKENNSLSNLEVISNLENMRHAFRIGLMDNRPHWRNKQYATT